MSKNLACWMHFVGLFKPEVDEESKGKLREAVNDLSADQVVKDYLCSYIDSRPLVTGQDVHAKEE